MIRAIALALFLGVCLIGGLAALSRMRYDLAALSLGIGVAAALVFKERG